MKKPTSPKHRRKPISIDAYLARVPEPARSTLKKVRSAIRSAAPPDANETISYGIPMFKYDGMLMGFAAFKNHCSLFPTSMAVVRTFENELKGCEVSKGTIRFPLDKPPLATLIKRMVKARLAEKKSKQQS